MEPLLRIFSFVLIILLYVTTPFFKFWALMQTSKPRKRLPPLDPILKQSATNIASRILAREVTSEEVVTAAISHARKVNPILNAIVQERFDEALKEAKQVDKRIDKLTQSEIQKLAISSPLLGVPLTIKESCSVKGMSLSVGSLKNLHSVAEEDGDCVKLLRDAGAIILLVSNTPEFCVSWESDNLVTGKTRNPFDPTRTAGGSSGGEGALIGSGASFIGIGSDLAGSIRIPALFNGIFGYKPTSRIVSLKGHFPYTSSLDDYLVIGPLARYAEDLILMIKVIAGDNVHKLELDKKVDISKLKVYYAFEAAYSITQTPVDKEIKNTIFEAVRHFETKYQLECKLTHFDEFEDIIEICCSVFFSMEDIPNFLQNNINPKKNDNLFVEILKSIFGLSLYSHFALGFLVLKETNALIPRSRNKFYIKKFKVLKEKLLNLLGDDGIFLFPTFPGPAHYHNQIYFRCTGTMYSMLFNCLGFPSCQIPLGFNSEGLPLGLQVVAAPYKDRFCLEIAQDFEKAFGGWSPPQ